MPRRAQLGQHSGRLAEPALGGRAIEVSRSPNYAEQYEAQFGLFRCCFEQEQTNQLVMGPGSLRLPLVQRATGELSDLASTVATRSCTSLNRQRGLRRKVEEILSPQLHQAHLPTLTLKSPALWGCILDALRRACTGGTRLAFRISIDDTRQDWRQLYSRYRSWRWGDCFSTGVSSPGHFSEPVQNAGPVSRQRSIQTSAKRKSGQLIKAVKQEIWCKGLKYRSDTGLDAGLECCGGGAKAEDFTSLGIFSHPDPIPGRRWVQSVLLHNRSLLLPLFLLSKPDFGSPITDAIGRIDSPDEEATKIVQCK